MAQKIKGFKTYEVGLNKTSANIVARRLRHNGYMARIVKSDRYNSYDVLKGPRR